MQLSLPLAELQALFRKSPPFKRVFWADVAHLFGDGALLVALPLLIYEQTHNIALTGLAFSGEVIAFGLMSPIAGYWADRLDQKKMMMLASSARVGLFGVLLLLLSFPFHLWLYLAISALIGAVGAFFSPARAAFVRRLLEGEELEQAIALEGSMGFLMRLIAPSIMGFLLTFQPVSFGIAVEMAACSIAVLFLAPAWVRGRELAPEEQDDEGEWTAGWSLIRQSPILRRILALDMALCVIGMAAFAMAVALLDEVFQLPPQANGWLLATTGLLGAIGTRLAGRAKGVWWVWPLSIAFIGVTYLAAPHVGILGFLLVMWALRGLAIGLINVLINQAIVKETPIAKMGRVQAAWSLAACVMAASGSAMTPFLVKYLGAGHSYELFGVLLLAIAAIASIPSWYREPSLDAEDGKIASEA